MGGCGNPNLVMAISEGCCWLSKMPGYSPQNTMGLISEEILKSSGGEGRGILSVHYDLPVYLPHSFDSYDGSYLMIPGRCNIPACIPPWTSATEKKFLDCLLDDLNKNLLAGRDKEPNLSRSASRPAMYSAVRTGAVENVVFVGGSNANNLALAVAALGVDTYKHAQGGWKVREDSVDKLIPDLKETLNAVPPDTLVVFFCLDNSSFMALKEDSNIPVISRCIEGDDGFHVVRELVVAPLNHVHIQLKREIEACGDHPVFIISPWPRFIRTPCCNDAAHVTNFNNTDFLSTILGDLNKHKSALRRAAPAATIIDGLELISGSGYNTERAAAVINSGWAFDQVHPSKHVYAKMALNLLGKIASQNQHRSEDRKRSWSVSNPGGGGGAAEGAKGAADTPAPAAAEAAADRPPEANSGRKAGGATASGLPTPTALRTDICTAANTATAGLSGDAAVATVAAATNTTARIMADSAAAAAEVAEGVGSAADTSLVYCQSTCLLFIFGMLASFFFLFFYVLGTLPKLNFSCVQGDTDEKTVFLCFFYSF
jgi:hypothetical protein